MLLDGVLQKCAEITKHKNVGNVLPTWFLIADFINHVWLVLEMTPLAIMSSYFVSWLVDYQKVSLINSSYFHISLFIPQSIWKTFSGKYLSPIARPSYISINIAQFRILMPGLKLQPTTGNYQSTI